MTFLLVLRATTVGGGPSGKYVVSFATVGLPQRFDDQPWTDVVVEEASSKTGPWTVLVEAPVEPVDTDPANPEERDVTIIGATLEQGWYRLTFQDENGDQSTIRPLYNGDSWSPSVQDVADKLAEYTRTRVDALHPFAGATTGVFTEETDPKASEVRGYIRAACGEVAGRADVEIPARCYEIARAAATCHAAAAVEASKGANGTDEADGAYRFHISSYRFNLDELIRKSRELAQTFLA